MPVDWIKKEAERIQTEHEKAKIHEDHVMMIGNLIRSSWGIIKDDLQNQIEEFNQNDEIRERYHRNLEYQEDGSVIKVKSITYPAIYMRIELRNSTIELEWSTITPTDLDKWSQDAIRNMEYQLEDKDSETLTVTLGPENSLLIDGSEGRRPFGELPEYILRKFLVEPTKFPGLFRLG